MGKNVTVDRRKRHLRTTLLVLALIGKAVLLAQGQSLEALIGILLLIELLLRA